MTPGTYLKKRREAQGLDLPQVAEALAKLPWAIRAPSDGEIALLVGRLEQAEADRDNLTVPQAELLRNCFRFDVDVYEKLLLRHYAGPHAAPLPDPQLCRQCACSWCDACQTDSGPCMWVEPDLCSACASLDALAAELGGSVHLAERELAPSARGPHA